MVLELFYLVKINGRIVLFIRMLDETQVEVKMNKYFEFNDDANNSHKFWEVNQKSKQATVSYGRIGILNPHQVIKEFDNKDMAVAFALKKIEEKQKKGYVQK